MTLKFEDPGLHGNASLDHQSIASELRANPGAWAIVAEDATHSLARQIRVGTLRAYRPAGHFEATVRGVDNATGRAAKVYARYVGAPEGEAS